MNEEKYRLYSRLGQIGIWLIFFLIYFTAELNYSSEGIAFFYALSTVAAYISLVYIHHYLIIPIFLKKQLVLYISCTISLILLISFGIGWLDVNFPFPYAVDQASIPDMIYNILLSTLVLAVGVIYYFVEAWIKSVQRESMLRNEKLHAELNFLKSQINPHFLFNTLNNIYSFVQTGNEQAGPVLERLSSILRFMVYDGKEERVTLLKELSVVKDLLEIYKMKNPDFQNISLEVEGAKAFHLIPPLLIINIIENACKHSDASSNSEGFIRISIQVDLQDHLTLEVRNSVRKVVPADPAYQGVGQENLKKRLALLYSENYQLKESPLTGEVYQLDLGIQLERKT